MGTLKTVELPISSLICESCRNDAPKLVEKYTPYILYDIHLHDEEGDEEPLTVTLDVQKLQWHRYSPGQYIACFC